MKKIILLLLLTFITLNGFAQITVSITGNCASLSGVYNFLDIFNGKNRYAKNFIIQGISTNLQVRFDNTQWILWADTSPTDFGFYNLTVPTTLDPPTTGWVTSQCLNGTMSINSNLSNNSFEILENISFKNPVDDYVIIEFKNEITNSYKFEIFNSIGKIVKVGAIINSEKISVSDLQAGLYILRIVDKNNIVFTRKLVKN